MSSTGTFLTRHSARGGRCSVLALPIASIRTELINFRRSGGAGGCGAQGFHGFTLMSVIFLRTTMRGGLASSSSMRGGSVAPMFRYP